MSLVKFAEIFKIYQIGKVEFPALSGVSFEVDEGEFLSIAGPSGSGKTTILNIIGCLDQPSRGSFYLNELDIGNKNGNELAEIRRHQIGFIFQTFNLIPILTAFENVEFPLVLKGDLSPSDRKALAEEMLTDVGLKDFMRRKPSEMSGGQQQRVAIARALVKKPSLVLADEPTANLDSKNGREVLELMLRLNQKFNATFIFSTHDGMVMDFARRVINLKDGAIASDVKRG